MDSNRHLSPLAALSNMILLPLLAATLVQSAAAQSAAEIIEQMEDLMRGESSYVEMTMTIERPRYTRDVSMKAWAMGEEYSLILITAPARDQGTTFLKRNNEIWNYIPNIDRTIKMPPSMMSQSWMGSDFTNDDLVRESSTIHDYEHRILREEELNGRESWVLELIPRPDTPIVWGKVLIWVSKENYMQLRMEQYGQSEELVNTIEFDRIQNLGSRTIPTRMTLTPEDRPDQHTIMTYQAMEFNIDIDESFFTQQNMRRVR
ncbi:MAG: outer membrane lipoprotein-sorting protein [Balneolaceae bacterium]